MELSDSMKEMLRELGEAINDSLSNSTQISETIDRIKDEGFDLFLILEATIGLNAKSGSAEEVEEQARPPVSTRLKKGAKRKLKPAGPEGAPEDDSMVFKISSDDRQFLHSLRISVDDLDENPSTKD